MVVDVALCPRPVVAVRAMPQTPDEPRQAMRAPPQFGAQISTEIKRWKKVVETAGIPVE
jgi:hypothetical protein